MAYQVPWTDQVRLNGVPRRGSFRTPMPTSVTTTVDRRELESCAPLSHPLHHVQRRTPIPRHPSTRSKTAAILVPSVGFPQPLHPLVALCLLCSRITHTTNLAAPSLIHCATARFVTTHAKKSARTPRGELGDSDHQRTCLRGSLLRHAGRGHGRVAFVQPHDAHAL